MWRGRGWDARRADARRVRLPWQGEMYGEALIVTVLCRYGDFGCGVHAYARIPRFGEDLDLVKVSVSLGKFLA
jgi:hypothetical protein